MTLGDVHITWCDPNPSLTKKALKIILMVESLHDPWPESELSCFKVQVTPENSQVRS